MTIRERWIRLRKSNKKSQQEIAELTGISRNAISLYESGKTDIGTEKMEKMIRSLDAEFSIKITM